MPNLMVNGVELYYELHGSGGDVIVLNNGIIANTRSWAQQIDALTPHFRVLVYDMRGQGRSQKWRDGDAPYSWETHAADLAALMDALDIESAHIGGISYGGELTMVFALLYPERCKKLIIADAVSHVEPQLFAICDSWARVAALGDHELFYRVTWYWNFSEAFFSNHYDLLESRVEAAHGLDLPSVEQLCNCFLSLDITDQLPQIAQPACVLVGEQDMLKPVHYSETIAANIPNAEFYVIPDAAHASFWEQPDEFNRVMTTFLLTD